MAGLYWTFEISGGEVQVSSDGRSATLEVGDKAIIDEPKFPIDGPVYDAVESFRITWEATGDLQTLEGPNKYFLIQGYPATVTGEFSVVLPELNFSFTGQATSNFAFLGTEVNGHYYMEGQQPPPAGQVFPAAAVLPHTGGAALLDTGGVDAR